MHLITPVIIAGGNGTRLWPLSRTQFPKQFLKLHSDTHTLLQSTLLRLKNIAHTKPIVICNEAHRFLVAEQLRDIDMEATIILEPEGKNTAPAITLAALYLSEQQQDHSLMLVLAADHVITHQDKFEASLHQAIHLANDDKMVTFGVVPTHAETGYGYIQLGKSLGDGYSIKRFVEKPNKEVAQTYIESGQYLWNSGMFLFKTELYLSELRNHDNDILQHCQLAINNAVTDLDFIHLNKPAFEQCPSNSIDYAVMEKTQLAAVVPLDAGWSDIGSWSALWEIEPKDKDGNATRGDVLTFQSQNNYCYSEDRLVSLLGVEDLVVIDTKDAILVANRHQVQDVKHIVEQLKETHRNEYYAHREVCRPWGKYDSICQADRYQVKHITVQAGQKLSLQMHHHRAEHWIVVKGTARIRKGDESILLTENQSVYIPLGEIHSLENPGKVPLELIEVQSGSYLGEDDIVRFEDVYGRV